MIATTGAVLYAGSGGSVMDGGPPVVSTPSSMLVQLTTPLIHFLDTRPKSLDISATKRLMDIKRLAERTLQEISTAKSEEELGFEDLHKFPDYSAKNSRRNGVLHKNSVAPTGNRTTAVSSVIKPTIREVEPAENGPRERRNDGELLMDIARELDSAKDLLAPKRSATSSEIRKQQPWQQVVKKKKPSKEKAWKKRILVALYPYTELTEEESNTTVMMRLLGHKFTRWWFKWKRMTLVLSLISILWWAVTYLMHSLWNSFWSKHAVVFTGTTLLAIGVFCLHYISVLNANVFTRCLQTYDAFFLLMEAFFFSSSYWAMTCFSMPALVLPVVLMLTCCTYIFYDSFPVAVRRKTKPVLIYGAIIVSSALVVLYGGLQTFQTCFYRMDVVYGLVLEDDGAAGAQKGGAGCSSTSISSSVSGSSSVASSAAATEGNIRSNWGFTVLDFCLNRGMTLIILMLKIIYSAYRHPHDCTIIRSRLRLIETTATSTYGSTQAGGATLSNASDIASSIATAGTAVNKNGSYYYSGRGSRREGQVAVEERTAMESETTTGGEF